MATASSLLGKGEFCSTETRSETGSYGEITNISVANARRANANVAEVCSVSSTASEQSTTFSNYLWNSNKKRY